MTGSPSRRYRSTTSPTSSARASAGRRAASHCASATRRPSFLSTVWQPSSRLAPARTRACSAPRFHDVTRSGTVCVSATMRGTPTRSMSSEASPVITVRVLKSTRLPIRLPRILPFLPRMREASERHVLLLVVFRRRSCCCCGVVLSLSR